MTRLCFEIIGHAEPAGSKRHIGGGRVVDANPLATGWKNEVGLAARAAMMRANGDEPELLDGALGLALEFYRMRPAGHFGNGRNADKLKPSAPAYPTTRPDTTKLTRGVEDAMTGVVWRDDSQVVEQFVTKRFGEPERVKVTVWTL
jgi:Holliday junction resolvase RusA-like endonuclease